AERIREDAQFANALARSAAAVADRPEAASVTTDIRGGSRGSFRRERFGDRDLAGRTAFAQFGARDQVSQGFVNGGGHVAMNGQTVSMMNFNQYVEGRRGLAFEHGLPRPASARLFVRQRHRLNAAHEV